MTRAFSALLYNTSPIDPATFLAVATILALVALGAALLPALHVAHTDPMMALRAE
jgi:putative ABC transport system permease protein